MSKQPEFIDHRDGNTLLAALQATLPEPPQRDYEVSERPTTSLAEVAIVTAFFSPAGFAQIADRLATAPQVRLLIGAEAPPEAQWPERRPGDPPEPSFRRAQVRDGLTELNAGLRRDRDRLPFNRATAIDLRRLVAMLRDGRLETRRYERAYLHAKAYIFDGLSQGFIAGSSNLTRAGLTTNLELNLGRWDPSVFSQARDWFNALWDEAVPFDLAIFYEEIEAEYTPYQIFLRVLWQLYGQELDREVEEVGQIPLTAFQQHGVWRAQRILEDFGGVIVADEVGLGKTFIAGAILDAFSRSRRRALIVCPAALRDTTWRQFLAEHGISRFVECVSFDQLGLDRQFLDTRRPNATQNHLDRDIEEYALVVVDEAHNYRNPDAAYRAGVLRRLLFGPRKDLVLLTATPVNNSLWDLFHLMRFFAREDAALAQVGIVSIRERFERASRLDPSNLNPDYLYPIIDAVTVKRTRGFVKKYYAGEQIRGPDGRLQPIIFPKPIPITVRYELDKVLPGFFDEVADALDPDHGNDLLKFARYAPALYELEIDEEEALRAEAAVGLLRSGLLKRFESSKYAFRLSLDRMLHEHERFLEALGKGKVITTAFLHELSATDDTTFDDLLEQSDHVADAVDYDIGSMRADVEHDKAIIERLLGRTREIDEPNDPKLAAVVEELARIADDAKRESVDAVEEARNRKVLVFSFYADTVEWLRRALESRIKSDARLAAYQGRIVAVAGSKTVDPDEVGRNSAVWGFAPESSRPPPGRDADLYDLALTTDVLAEGMNLQQCRNIINYDMPWNPMRLVQRHGRIDRIGSPHSRVFMRTVFPADRLNDLLNLEQRILRKLTQAARSIGVGTPPIAGAEQGEQVFSETRAEIEKLAREDPSLYERGGTESAAQTGEEYRQRLRTALELDREAVVNLPGKAGSGMRRGPESGVFFCAEVETVTERRTFLRFVPANLAWRPSRDSAIIREVGTCLRLIDCTPETERHMPAALQEAVFSFWDVALADIQDEWQRLSDPINLQPRIRPLNRRVAEFIRNHPPHEADGAGVARALDILEAPWPRREEALLRDEFEGLTGDAQSRVRRMVEWILNTGLEPFIAPAPLPEIELDDVRLICWLAIEGSGVPSTD